MEENKESNPTTGPWQPKGIRYLTFYHYRKYEILYSRVKPLLLLLGGKLLKDIKAVLSTVEDIISLGINQAKCQISNLIDHVESLKYGELEEFVHKLIPRIASMALEAESLFPEEDHYLLLEAGFERELTFTRMQVLCLLSLSFFGLIPSDVSDDLPSIRLICSLFYKSEKNNKRKVVKLPFIFSYFTHSLAALRNGDESLLANITFKRLQYQVEQRNSVSYWQTLDMPMGEIEIDTYQKIEEYDGTESIKVDFANK